jgi:F0F1-type ATP synthase delta subunit
MTHTPKQYAEALYQALEKKSEVERLKVLKRFLAMLEKNKQMNSLRRILNYYERIFLKERGLVKVDIESASPLPTNVRDTIEKQLGKPMLVSEKVNADLLAGLTIIIDDRLSIDASGRTRLTHLFT